MLNPENRQRGNLTEVANDKYFDIMLNELIYKYRSVILILLVVIFLLGIRLLAGDHFRHGAKKNALPALSGSNTMELSQFDLLKTKALLVYLDKESEVNVATDVNVLYLKPGELLSKQTVRYIRKSEGPIILLSDDPTISARAWMLLAQKGITNLFIFARKEDIENFKYEFQPDTVTVTEGP
jgi:hypothetical protein